MMFGAHPNSTANPLKRKSDRYFDSIRKTVVSEMTHKICFGNVPIGKIVLSKKNNQIIKELDFRGV